MMDKAALVQQQIDETVERELPDLAEFLTELNEAGMKPDDVDVIDWPKTEDKK